MTYTLPISLVVLLSLNGLFSSLHAAEVTISIQDNQGQPLTNIVALLRTEATVQARSKQPLQGVMDQINREFVPHTLVVQQGTRVSFPNSDNVQHHVYSFSPAKIFELKLYSELDIEPLLFDKPGVVELGCNVHDWMLGYIYVADTPYFAQSDGQGLAVISAPTGQYSLSLWHPRLGDKDLARVTTVVVDDQKLMVNLGLQQPLLPSLVEYDAVEGFNNYD